MGYYYWNSICVPAARLPVRSSATTGGTRRLIGTGTAGWPRFPKRPEPTWGGFWLLLSVLTLLLPASSRSQTTHPILERQSIMFFTSCTELEQVTRRSYLGRGCIPSGEVQQPTYYGVVWSCVDEVKKFWIVTQKSEVSAPGWCTLSKLTCLHESSTWSIFVLRPSTLKTQICEEQHG
jgi:hypothetical protein